VNSAKFGETSAFDTIMMVAIPSQASCYLDLAVLYKLIVKSRKYTDKELEDAVKSSYSISAVLKELNLTPAGGNVVKLLG
jgi:hypothetical protein